MESNQILLRSQKGRSSKHTLLKYQGIVPNHDLKAHDFDKNDDTQVQSVLPVNVVLLKQPPVTRTGPCIETGTFFLRF